MPTVFELDDFTTDEASLWTITDLKRRYPALKVTLFAVLGRCQISKLLDLRKLDWLEIHPHGLTHADEHLWGYDEMARYLYAVDDILGYTGVFRLPWETQPTSGALRAIAEFHYALATRNRMHIAWAKDYGIPLYLGCEWSRWYHPFQLTNIDFPDGLFYTVTEIMARDDAEERGWVWCP